MTANPLRVLVLFSNPPDTERLRLDKEDRELDDLARRLRGYREVQFTRRHASTPSDLIDLLLRGNYEVVHFSGHGSPDGIVLEDPDSEDQVIVDVDFLARIYALNPGDRVRVLLFMSCFSATAVDRLVRFAPYIIAIDGPASDAAAIVFTKNFYSIYAQEGSVQRAFDGAMLHVASREHPTALDAVLTQRARYTTAGKLVIEAEVGSYPDAMVIDLSAVEQSISHLGIPREELLELLARRIRIHQWIFNVPREHAFLCMDATLLGDFSWSAADSCIRCNRLLRLRDDVDPGHWQTWSGLLVSYNDMCAERYRSFKNPADPSLSGYLATAVSRFSSRHRAMRDMVDGLVSLGFPKVGLSYALAGSYLQVADARLREDELPMVVAYLESALSAIHELIAFSMPATYNGR